MPADRVAEMRYACGLGGAMALIEIVTGRRQVDCLEDSFGAFDCAQIFHYGSLPQPAIVRKRHNNCYKLLLLLLLLLLQLLYTLFSCDLSTQRYRYCQHAACPIVTCPTVLLLLPLQQQQQQRVVIGLL